MYSDDRKMVMRWAEHAAAPMQGKERCQAVMTAIKIALTTAVDQISQMDEDSKVVWDEITVVYRWSNDNQITAEIAKRGDDLILFVGPCDEAR